MKYSNLFKCLLALVIGVIICNPCNADYANDAKIQYNKGVDLYHVGQFEQAADCFRQATELDPNYIDAYYNLGALLEYLKQDEAALNAFKQIILRKPEDYEAVYKAAQISKKIGDIDKAKMYLTLIPTDSLVGQRAKQLAASMELDMPVDASVPNEPAPPAYAETNSQSAANNTIYNDIPSPTGVVTDEAGTLYVAGFSDNTIYKIGADNKKIVYLKDSKIDGPIGIARDGYGNLYIANYNKNNVLKVDPYGAVSVLISDIKNPYCMYITNDLLYVSSQGSNSVVKFRL